MWHCYRNVIIQWQANAELDFSTLVCLILVIGSHSALNMKYSLQNYMLEHLVPTWWSYFGSLGVFEWEAWGPWRVADWSCFQPKLSVPVKNDITTISEPVVLDGPIPVSMPFLLYLHWVCLCPRGIQAPLCTRLDWKEWNLAREDELGTILVGMSVGETPFSRDSFQWNISPYWGE